MPRLVAACAALALVACGESPPPSGEIGPRGPIDVTTWSDGAVAGGLRVYVHDETGAVRGGFTSDEDGGLRVEIGEGWGVTSVDDRGGAREIHSVLDLAPGDSLDLGNRRPGDDGAVGEVAIAPMDDASGRVTVRVCGSAVVETPIADPAAASIAYYRRGSLDEQGGALLIARSDGAEGARVAVLDVEDVPALEGAVTFPAWQQEAAAPVTTWFAAGPAGAGEVEIAVRGAHGCLIGGGRGAGPSVTVSQLAGLAVSAVAGTAWYRDDADGQSRATRHLGEVPGDAAIDLADPPARIDGVALTATSRMALRWDVSDDDGGADGLVISSAPSPDTEWTILAPADRSSMLLPDVPEIGSVTPSWIAVSLVDLDEADGYAELVPLAGTAITAAPGWTVTGTRSY